MQKYTFNSVLESPVTNIQDLNSSFAFGTLKVAYTGLNANGTNFTREAFENSATSMFNCPIVANYDVIENEIGGHDMGSVDVDGEEKIINITEPVGVVPESATYHWETLMDNGTPHDYFCIDNVVLWKRQACYKKLVENGITAQSFEIQPTKGTIEDNSLRIEEFEFQAFCLLESVEPCFEQASLEVFSKQDSFKTQIAEMLEEYAKTTGGVKMQTHIETKVEETTVETVETTIVNSETDPEVVVFDTPEQGEIVETETQDTAEAEPEAVSYTAQEIFSMLRATCCEFELDYSVDDFTDDLCIIFDWKTETYIGFPYQIEDGKASIDFNAPHKMKITFVPAEKTDGEVQSYALISEAMDRATVSVETKYSSEIDELNQQIEELSKFRKETLEQQRQDAETALFSKFDNSLKHSDEYKKLKDSSDKYSIEELETQCFALLGKQIYSVHASNTIRVPLDSVVEDNAEAYGGLLRKMKKI